LETFFAPGAEILLPTTASEIVRYLRDWNSVELRRIGEAAQARVMQEHTSSRRAYEFEQAIVEARIRKGERTEALA
jgi:spore maturation protein CgeB